MGNHQSQVSVHKAKAAPNNISNNITPEERKNSLNANSGYDIQEKENSLIHPVEKLAQVSCVGTYLINQPIVLQSRFECKLANSSF